MKLYYGTDQYNLPGILKDGLPAGALCYVSKYQAGHDGDTVLEVVVDMNVPRWTVEPIALPLAVGADSLVVSRYHLVRAETLRKREELSAKYPTRKGLCSVCGGPLPPLRRRYCSDECARQYGHEYWLTSPQGWSEEIERRAEFKCQWPGCDRSSKPPPGFARYTHDEFHAHHIVPIIANGGGGKPLDLDNGMWLCSKHHGEAHRKLNLTEKTSMVRLAHGQLSSGTPLELSLFPGQLSTSCPQVIHQDTTAKS